MEQIIGLKWLERLIQSIDVKLSLLPAHPFGRDYNLLYPNRRKRRLSDAELQKLSETIEELFAQDDGKSFRALLRAHMTEKGFTPRALYSAALIEKSYFYQVLGGKHIPSRDTAIRLCLALKLNLDESITLLQTLGHCFYEKNRRDIIVMECLNFSAGLYYAELLLERYNEMSLCNKSILHSQEFS